MKGQVLMVATALATALLAQPVAPTFAQCSFSSGSTGADGAFNPTANVTVLLPPDGIFNFTTVNIPSGVTVSFKPNANNTPVFMLASGNVIINGVIDVSGTGNSGGIAGIGGPGGFGGGEGAIGCGGAGLGPGAGSAGCGGVSSSAYGGSGGFGTGGGSWSGSHGGSGYGNPELMPLIGGSGGGGGSGVTSIGFGGGGGGGAILIASSTTVTVGTIRANGGQVCPGGAGSGGAIRIVANTFAGGGALQANGGANCLGGNAGIGRIRLEACVNTYTGTFTQYATTVGLPSAPFAANIPNIAITSIDGVVVPAMPAGSFTTPDVSLPTGTTTATVQLAASGIPLGTTIAVTVTPQIGVASTVISSPLIGTQSASTGNAVITLAPGASIISAETTITVAQTGSAPIMVGSIDGEKIEKVRVAATYGGRSSLTYITASGREVAAGSAVAD